MVKKMFRNIIYFPHSLGQGKNGVNLTPNLISPFIQRNKNNCYVSLNHNSLFSNINELYNQNKLINGPRINIGGDHSMAIATVADSLNKHDNLKVIWFDAHPDINTWDKSESKNYHGMPLSFITGIDKDSRFNFINKNLDFKNILYIGIRDIDPFEQEIIDKHQIKYINCNDFNQNFEQSWKIITEFISDNPIHISFDVDCLDPKFMISTGTRSDNGLDLLMVKNCLDDLFDLNQQNKINICNIDITELNLELGSKQEQMQSLANVLFLFDKIF